MNDTGAPRHHAHFLHQPPHAPDTQALYDQDVADIGHVMNASRLWAYQPATHDVLFDLLAATTAAGDLTFRQRGVLVSATAATLGDSYCSLAWGSRLAHSTSPEIAAGVLRGDDTELTPPERALAHWARLVVTDPSATTTQDIDVLRHAGYTDEQIFAITVYVSLRIAFSTINAALGANPDAPFATTTPTAVRDAITFGRPIETSTTPRPT